MTEQQLQLFDDLGFYEGVDVEYKGAKGGLPRDLWETYSAFANTDGGTLWLGITQRAGKLDVHGVTDAEKLVTDFWNTLNNRGKVNRNRFASRDPNHPWHKEDDLGLLTKLQGWRRDRASGLDGLTVAGLLMFGKTEAITAPEAVPGFQLDYRERLSDDPAIRWTDRLTVDGTWDANLFQFYQRVILKLASGPGIKSRFQTDAEGYRQAGGPVHAALQEALVNALIHADYSGQGGIVIDRYPNRFEFSNPGTLLVSREQILRGSVSECRNKSLQLMFQMLGVGDKAGSGIDKIRQSWAAEHWQSPSLRETVRPDRVSLTLPMVSMLPDSTVQELRARFGEIFEQLDRHEVQVVVTAAIEDEVTNQRLQEILTLHRVDITKLLQGLVRKKLLVPEGFGRGTRYALPDILANGGSSEANGGSSETDSEIVTQVRTSQRAATDLVERAILTLCAKRFLTPAELAAALNRRPKTLQNSYLFKLVARGDLEQRYPENRTHRNQAYRAAKVSSDA